MNRSRQTIADNGWSGGASKVSEADEGLSLPKLGRWSLEPAMAVVAGQAVGLASSGKDCVAVVQQRRQ